TKLSLLGVWRVDERQTRDPDVVAGDRHRRLDRDRIRVDREDVDHRLELGLDLACAREVAVLKALQKLTHALPDEMGEDEDAASPSHLEERQQKIVVPCVEREAALVHD